MKITAYKCPNTGKIFELKSDFDKHRKRFLSERRRAQNEQKLLNKYNKILKDFRANPGSWQDMGNWICDNTDVFIERNCLIRSDRKVKTMKFTSVNILVRYSEHCSNTHDAPFNGVTNWGCEPHLPLGYPGWTGRIELTYTGEYDGFFSDIFDGTGLNFGSGSGGRNTYQSGLILFEDDWPGLREQRVFDLLNQ